MPMFDDGGVDEDGDVKGAKGEGAVWSFCAKGRRRYGGSEEAGSPAAPAAERRAEDEKMWSKRELKDPPGPPAPAAKGGLGMPVNSCTMARKFEVSVVSTVVGARRDARALFRDPLGGAVAAAADGSGA